jgi:hypothetical protein
MTANKRDNYAGGYRQEGAALVLHIHAQPGARATAFAGMHGDRIKIRLAAPPIEGRANECLREFLAAEFGVPRSRVMLLRGDTGRSKDVQITEPWKFPPGFRSG